MLQLHNNGFGPGDSPVTPGCITRSIVLQDGQAGLQPNFFSALCFRVLPLLEVVSPVADQRAEQALPVLQRLVTSFQTAVSRSGKLNTWAGSFSRDPRVHHPVLYLSGFCLLPAIDDLRARPLVFVLAATCFDRGVQTHVVLFAIRATGEQCGHMSFPQSSSMMWAGRHLQ